MVFYFEGFPFQIASIVSGLYFHVIRISVPQCELTLSGDDASIFLHVTMLLLLYNLSHKIHPRRNYYLTSIDIY